MGRYLDHELKREMISFMLGTGSYEDCSPTWMDKRTIYQFADSWYMKFKDILDSDGITGLIESHGGHIYYQSFDLNKEIEGTILVNSHTTPPEFHIILPHYTHETNDMFTLAHEYGHFLLHSRCGEISIGVNRKEKGRAEMESDYFASAILMPTTKLEKMFKKHKTITADILHRDIGVTIEDASYRIETFNNFGY